MRTQGSLIKWNADRGFGFIRTRDSGIEVFVHVSEFPRSGRTPQIGDILHFEITTDPEGRKRAKAVAFDTPASSPELTLARIERTPAARMPAASDPHGHRQDPRRDAHAQRPRREKPRRESSGLGSKVVVGTLLLGGAVFAYQKFAPLQTPPVDMPQIQNAQTTAAPVAANHYVCDGRQHCSQMRSCEEATWFIRNCPNTKMDGEGDGVPCEQQHCD
jgi:cold shock CspA family protein